MSAAPRDFAVLLHNLEDGQLLIDLSARAHELQTKLAQVAQTVGAAKGELWLKLKLNVDEGGTVQVDTDIVVKEPRVKRARSMMWLSKQNHLVTENPKQQALFPREVPAPPAPKDLPTQASADPRGA